MSDSLEASSGEEARVLHARFGPDLSGVRRVRSPYRICPVGAHVDHQGGAMLATAIDAATELFFVPADRVELESANYPGPVDFDPGGALTEGALPEGLPDWGRYVFAALAALRDRLPARPRGFRGLVRGRLPGSGLSSSASVLLAYLSAWCEVNAVTLEPRERVLRTVAAENDHVGVQCGVLDPAAIVGSQRGQLLRIDSTRVEWTSIPLGPGARDHRFLVFFTGTDRSLLATDFNLRVAECGEAARWAAARTPAVEQANVARLGDLDRGALRGLVDEMPARLSRRARHFVGECDRVDRAERAWREGDLEAFGALMSDSCRSSIECYETGSPELVALQAIWDGTEGVLGARFSGAGFGGCSLALVSSEGAEAVGSEVLARFGEAFPALRDRARVIAVESQDGLAVA